VKSPIHSATYPCAPSVPLRPGGPGGPGGLRDRKEKGRVSIDRFSRPIFFTHPPTISPFPPFPPPLSTYPCSPSAPLMPSVPSLPGGPGGPMVHVVKSHGSHTSLIQGPPQAATPLSQTPPLPPLPTYLAAPAAQQCHHPKWSRSRSSAFPAPPGHFLSRPALS
jgi:hypothetical protein